MFFYLQLFRPWMKTSDVCIYFFFSKCHIFNAPLLFIPYCDQTMGWYFEVARLDPQQEEKRNFFLSPKPPDRRCSPSNLLFKACIWLFCRRKGGRYIKLMDNPHLLYITSLIYLHYLYIMVYRERRFAWSTHQSKIGLNKIRLTKSKSDVWLTVHRNSVWIRKTN